MKRCLLPHAVTFLASSCFAALLLSPCLWAQSAPSLMEQVRISFDAAAFYHLASRAGCDLDARRAEEIMACVKECPDRLPSLLKRWGIVYDADEAFEETTSKWRRRHGKRSVILRSQHYDIFATDKDLAHARLAGYYLDHLIGSGLDRLLGPAQGALSRYTVAIHPNLRDYMRAGAPRGSVAFFDASRRQIGIYVRRGELADQEVAKNFLKNLFHEAAHQAALFRFPCPRPWLDEGIATQAEYVGVTPTGIAAPEEAINPVQLCTLQEVINDGEALPFRALCCLDRASFERFGAPVYAQAWGWVYFFRHGPVQYQKQFKKLLALLRQGEDSCQAVSRMFAAGKAAKMQADWQRFCLSLKEGETDFRLASSQCLERYFAATGVSSPSNSSSSTVEKRQPSPAEDEGGISPAGLGDDRATHSTPGIPLIPGT